MLKKISFFILFLISSIAVSQVKDSVFSIDFNNISRKEALLKIEKASNHKLFYDENWFAKDSLLINKNFNQQKIATILDDVLTNSEFNYYLQNDKIIIIKNNVIYDKLPDNYLKNIVLTKKEEDQNQPIFQKQYDTNESNENKENNTLTIIGKDSQNNATKNVILAGKITDSKTGESLPFVTIRVKDKNISVVTDNDGNYKIKVPKGINYIEFESINHKKITRKVILYNDGIISVPMTEKANMIEEVVINKKMRDKLKNASTGVTTIDIEGIKNVPLVLGERDIFKVATTMPGIKTTGEGSAGYNVRGGKEDQNLILLDNAVIYNPAHFFGFFSSVNPITTKKATIYKGSIPSEFGGRLSSVFDLSTKNASTEKKSGEGGIGPVTSNVSFGTPIIKGKSSLLIGLRGTYSGWILKSLKEETLKKSKASFYDGIIKYNHLINKNNTLESTIYYSNDEFSITSDSLYGYSNRLISLKWEHKFNPKSKSSFIATNSDYKFKINYDNENHQQESFDFGYRLNETQFQFKLNYILNEKNKINYGISSKLYQINPGFLNPINPTSIIVPIDIQKEKGLESAIYISDGYKLNDKIQLEFGLRYSIYNSLGSSSQKIYEEGKPLNEATVVEVKNFENNQVIKTYGGFEPRISGRYLLSDSFSIKAGYDRTNQYIHLLSTNTTQSPTDTWKLSDLNVKPQIGEQFSIGFFKNLNNQNLEISLEGYYKKTKNILDYKVGAQTLLNENIETQLLQGLGKAYGVELLLKKDEGILNGWIGYTYSRSFIKLDSEFNDEKVNNGQYFSANFDKPHEVSVVLNYKFTKRYSFSTNFIYQTGRPITYPIGAYDYGGLSYTLYSDRNKFRIPDYYRLDIGFNVEGTHKINKPAHGFWNISIYNVLGRNNPYSIYFVTDAGKIKAYKTSIFSIPIPTITYNFKF